MANPGTRAFFDHSDCSGTPNNTQRIALVRTCTLISVVVLGLAVGSARAEWMLQWVDANTGAPLPENEIHVLAEAPFSIGVAAEWFGSETPDVYGYELAVHEDGLEFGDVEFDAFRDARDWPVDEWDVGEYSTEDNFPPAEFDTLGDSHVLRLGTLTLTAPYANEPWEEGDGEVVPWEIVADGYLQTVFEESPEEYAESDVLSVWTDGEPAQPDPRDLIPPVAQPFLPPVTELFFNPDPGNTVDVIAETAFYWDGDPEPYLETSESSSDVQPFFASQTTGFGPYGDNSARATAQAEVLTTEDDGFVVFSMTATSDVDLHGINEEDNGMPGDPFQAYGTVNLEEMWVWIGPDGEFNYGDVVMATVSAGEEITAQGSFGGDAEVQWTCVVSSRITGEVVAELDAFHPTAAFPVEVGDDLIFTAMLDAYAESGLWFYNADDGLYYAGEGHAEAAVDVWVTTQPVPEPSTLLLTLAGAATFIAGCRRRR